MSHPVRQVTKTFSIRMEWTRVNEIFGMITTMSGLIPPLRTEYLQENWPYSIIQLYLGSIQVLSNSSMSIAGGSGHRRR